MANKNMKKLNPTRIFRINWNTNEKKLKVEINQRNSFDWKLIQFLLEIIFLNVECLGIAKLKMMKKNQFVINVNLEDMKKKAKCPTCSNAYCGYCLQKFYCENVLEILGDVDQYKSLKTRKEKQLLEVWSCPSCRNICLCKFCRTNNGFSPIDESTFDTHDRPSIAHYLIETFARSSYSEDEFHEDSKRCRNHNQDLISNKYKDENAMFSLKNKTEVEKGDFIACRAPPEHGLYFYLGCVKKKSWKKKCFSSLDGT